MMCTNECKNARVQRMHVQSSNYANYANYANHDNDAKDRKGQGSVQPGVIKSIKIRLN